MVKWFEELSAVNVNEHIKQKNGLNYLSWIYWAIDELFKSGVKVIDTFNITNKLQSNAAVKKKIDSVNMPDMDDFFDMCEDAARTTIEEYVMDYIGVEVE